MDGDVHDIAGIEAQPADWTGEFAFEVGQGRRRKALACGCGNGARARNNESGIAVRAVTGSASVLLIRLQFLTARWTQKSDFHIGVLTGLNRFKHATKNAAWQTCSKLQIQSALAQSQGAVLQAVARRNVMRV